MQFCKHTSAHVVLPVGLNVNWLSSGWIITLYLQSDYSRESQRGTFCIRLSMTVRMLITFQWLFMLHTRCLLQTETRNQPVSSFTENRQCQYSKLSWLSGLGYWKLTYLLRSCPNSFTGRRDGRTTENIMSPLAVVNRGIISKQLFWYTRLCCPLSHDCDQHLMITSSATLEYIYSWDRIFVSRYVKRRCQGKPWSDHILWCHFFWKFHHLLHRCAVVSDQAKRLWFGSLLISD